MSTRQIHVFISHSWSHSEHYDALADWISNQSYSIGQASLDFRDYSVPKDDPIHDAASDKELEAAIFDKISRSHVVIIPTGMYAQYSRWIQKEISGAEEYAKPILAVNPWGQKRRSSFVQQSADRSCGWNRDVLIRTVWEMYKESGGI